MAKAVMSPTMMSKTSNVLRISLLSSSDDLWNMAMAVKTPTTMSNAFPPVQSSHSFLPSTMPGTYIDHPLLQKTPEVLHRQSVDASRPTIDDQDGIDESVHVSESRKTATPVNGRTNTVFAIGR